MRILLIHKQCAAPTKKPTKAVVLNLEYELALARVQRPDLVQFFVTGQFHKLPAVPAAVIKNPALRRRDYGEQCYVLTPADLGRATTSPQTIAMAVRQWIEKYLVPAGVIARDQFAIVIEP